MSLLKILFKMTKPPFEVPRGVFRARVARGGAEEEVRRGGPERRPRGGAGRAGQGQQIPSRSPAMILS